MVSRRRRNVLVVMQHLLKFAICRLSLVALLSVHLRFFPSSKVPRVSDGSRKLRTYEVTSQVSGIEHIWKREIVQPHSKAPVSSHKLDGVNRSSEFNKLWKSPSNRDFLPCIEPSPDYADPGQSRGLLLVHTNGGLDQMRAGNFSDVVDEEYFINALANDVKIVRKLPKQLATTKNAVKHFRSWYGMDYYPEEIGILWEEYELIQAAKSDPRLANNNLQPDIQKLCCRACYEALHFAPQIEVVGKEVVSRMRVYGSYIALHLRYEKDMLAFSGCTHDLSAAEADKLRRTSRQGVSSEEERPNLGNERAWTDFFQKRPSM